MSRPKPVVAPAAAVRSTDWSILIPGPRCVGKWPRADRDEAARLDDRLAELEPEKGPFGLLAVETCDQVGFADAVGRRQERPHRPRDEPIGRAVLLREVVECCRLALEVYTREALPQQWAWTLSNLAYVLHNEAEAVCGLLPVDSARWAAAAPRLEQAISAQRDVYGYAPTMSVANNLVWQIQS